MVVVPPVIGVTTPVDALIVATAVLLLVQTPPAMVFANVEDDPTQTVVLPVIAATVGVNVEQVPVTVPAAQLEVAPVKAKLIKVPLLPLPLASVTVDTPALLPFTKP